MRRIENFVAIHDRHKVFGLGEVDNVVSIAREHVDALDIVTGDFKFDDLAFGIVKIAFLDKAMASNHNEELPLGIMPVLTFGDAWLGDIN